VRRLFAGVVIGLIAALGAAGTAQARSYELVAADVGVAVGNSGALAVEEKITVSFVGPYTFGFRDIPLREGETIDEIGVFENGRGYAPGASTALQPGGPAGTYGFEQSDDQVRIVWRFSTLGETRTFTLRWPTTTSSTSASRSGGTSGSSGSGGSPRR
jgi:hypothetical protein